ncbi:MAG: hypothetical protein HYU39_07835 [Thaumarchaeota archaeon]|nr:hypothetical protein [Nitrososphaerota archaeon]
MPWKTIFTHTFERDFRKLASEIQERTTAAIEELSSNEDPCRLSTVIIPRSKTLRNTNTTDVGLHGANA